MTDPYQPTAEPTPPAGDFPTIGAPAEPAAPADEPAAPAPPVDEPAKDPGPRTMPPASFKAGDLIHHQFGDGTVGLALVVGVDDVDDEHGTRRHVRLHDLPVTATVEVE